MNKKSLITVSTCCAVAAINSVPVQAKDKPNIILINADDLGVMDVGFMGDKRYHTPNLDKLASEGMVFTQAYAAAANCAPSRAAMLSGQWASRTGVYTVGNSARGKAQTRKLIPIKNSTSLPEKNVSLFSALKANGYLTCQIGKWHVSSDPALQGVDVNIAGNHRGGPKSYFSPYKNPQLKDGPKGEYLTDRLTDEAIKFITDNKKKSFFLYFPYYTVHTPLQARKDLLAKYQDREDVHPQYAGMVHALDENIGRLMESVKANGLEDKTIVIFTSDNGGIAAITSQAPFRAGKGSYYEGGVREPFLVRWPGKVKPGTKCDVPISQLDIYPTLLAATGTAKPEGKVLDGVNIMPLLTQSGNIKKRALFWHFPIYLQAYNGQLDDARDPLFRTRPGSTMLYGKWKLHHYFEDDAYELYDLEKDIGERNNLAKQNPEKLEELKKMLNAWRQEVKAPIPTEKNPKYDPDFKPKPKKKKKKKQK